jgi:hypothetical protein
MVPFATSHKQLSVTKRNAPPERAGVDQAAVQFNQDRTISL